MKKALLIFGIITIILAVCSLGLTALFFIAYVGTHDGTYEMAKNQFTAIIVFGILTLVLFIAGILMIRFARH